MCGEVKKKIWVKKSMLNLSVVPKFIWKSLYIWGSQEKNLGQKGYENFFRVDPGKK